MTFSFWLRKIDKVPNLTLSHIYCDKMSRAIGLGLSWVETGEGYDYWDNAVVELMDNDS